MIETLTQIATAVGFGIAITLIVVSSLLMYQLFIGNSRKFNSWLLMIQVASLLMSVGFSILYVTV